MSADTKSRRPRMIDVARLAGVSHQSVSRVLNGRPHVSADVKRRVEYAVQALGYRRNTAARALATRKTMNLGVVCVGTSQYGPARTLIGIADAAREHDYLTSLVSLGQFDRASMRAALDHLAADSVDGIVVMAPITAAAAALEGLSAGVPLVMFEPGIDDGGTTIAHDETLGARLATRHLLELGHETVHHLSGPPGWLGTDARIEGWRQELSVAKRVAHPLFRGDWSSESGYRVGLEQLAQDDVSAVFVANDQMALGLLKAADELGLKVPQDLSVVGFDDMPEAKFFRPALTTVHLDFFGLGRQCVQRLLCLILDETAKLPLVQPPLLIPRDSTSPPRRRRIVLGDELKTLNSHIGKQSAIRSNFSSPE
jgi:DNA-binding LacI/PurR family transcriptional regulator